MLKKIILGIVIAVVLSVTAFGTIYAYQKEKERADESVSKGKPVASIRFRSRKKTVMEYVSGDNEDCLKEEERIRNNFRQRQNEDQECTGEDGEETYVAAPL